MEMDFSRSIVEIVLSHADRTPDAIALVFDGREGAEARLTYAQLASGVRSTAGGLREHGLSGERVGLVFSAGADFVVTLLGCLAAGCVVAPIAPIGRRRARLQNTLAQLERLEPAGVVLDRTMETLFGEELSASLVSRSIAVHHCATLAEGDAKAVTASVKPNDLAVLQFTSGTTSVPKKVMITHRNIVANETMIKAAFGHDSRSHFVGWVPHYHDQGLFGNILQPLFLGSTCVLTSPAAFMNRPIFWLELISRHGAHTSGGPNFGYELCVRYAERRSVPSLDLSSWRVAFNGAERVQPRTLQRFADCFEPFGFDRRAFLPCYGLAESTLVTVAMPPWTSPVVKRFDSALLATGEAREVPASASATVELTCCGPAMAGGEALVVEPATARRLERGKVGEVWLRGPHIAAGYLGDDKTTQDTFSAVLADGDGPFLRTGDLAFAETEGLYVVGRIKDTIIVRGRNYAASDIEQLWTELTGNVGQGNSAAIQIDSGEAQHVVLVAEVKRGDMRKHQGMSVDLLAQGLRALAIERLELGVTDLLLVPEGSIPRTTSGKVQRLQLARSLGAGEVSWLAASGPLRDSLITLQSRFPLSA